MSRVAPASRGAGMHADGHNQRWRYATFLALLGLGLAVSAMPSPLYALYSRAWHYPPVVTTVIFAAYAVGGLAAILVSGTLSDRHGRRPILIVALLLVLVGLGIFIFASGAAFLIAARLVNGLGIGATVVTAGAALLDVRPTSTARTGVLNAIALNVGIAFGAISSSIIAESDLMPMLTPYLVFAVATLAGLLAVVVMREPHTHPANEIPPRARRIPRPHVPPRIRRRFLFAASGAGATWAVLGVFLSLEPAIATSAVHATGPLFAGIVIAVFAVGAALAQALGARFSPRPVALVGDFTTAAMLLLCIVAFSTGDSVVILGSALLLGGAYGLAFAGSLSYLVGDLPAAHRGSVMSAFYMATYSSIAIPTILAGIAATIWTPRAVLAPFNAIGALLIAAVASFELVTKLNR